jgi:hypothetical protein
MYPWQDSKDSKGDEHDILVLSADLILHHSSAASNKGTTAMA